MSDEHRRIERMIRDRSGKVFQDPSRSLLIENSVQHWNAIRLESGTLVTWSPQDSTGRSPKDTVIVRRPESEPTVDWDAPNSIPITPDTFDMLFEDTLYALGLKDRLYVLNRTIGADPEYALPVTAIMHNALAGLFIDNMFRPVPQEVDRSCFAEKPFYLLISQFDKLDPERYEGRLRTLADGTTSRMVVVMDFDRRVGIVFGSSYMGAIKKLMFTVMNYYLPNEGILPLHCSANEGADGDMAVFLGLSGTGKTTLSTAPGRALIGDDEHGWSDRGIANFENGCYAKLYNLDPQKEPEVYRAVFHPDHYLSHGALVENLMVYPNGTFDFDDDRFTQNSRASYPLAYLSNVKPSSVGGHPQTVIFLTADAYGVLPPISRLSTAQAMFWFMMGYTSKLAGTETGVMEPQTVFSRFFGAPFMPRNPKDYTDLLGERLERHETRVFLVNTGWSGGAYGEGRRMDINLTRAMVQAALSGALDTVAYEADPFFGVRVPASCPGVPDKMLTPVNTWAERAAYGHNAARLAGEFRAHFDREFRGKVPETVARECPSAPVEAPTA
ncbi:MAG: phosphoenolpyruvate carboxykinase (ATP) [Spirochaetia bacterium]